MQWETRGGGALYAMGGGMELVLKKSSHRTKKKKLNIPADKCIEKTMGSVTFGKGGGKHRTHKDWWGAFLHSERLLGESATRVKSSITD